MTPRGPDPRTMAGKALLAARPLETETMNGRTLRSPDKVLRKAILDIEAEAAALPAASPTEPLRYDPQKEARKALEAAARLKQIAADIRSSLPAASPALDVERLATILFRFDIGCEGHGNRTRHQSSDHRWDAEAIAAEYERLAEQEEAER